MGHVNTLGKRESQRKLEQHHFLLFIIIKQQTVANNCLEHRQIIIDHYNIMSLGIGKEIGYRKGGKQIFGNHYIM